MHARPTLHGRRTHEADGFPVRLFVSAYLRNVTSTLPTAMPYFITSAVLRTVRLSIFLSVSKKRSATGPSAVSTVAG